MNDPQIRPTGSNLRIDLQNPRDPEIPSNLAQLRRQIERLEKVKTELSTRLVPIIRVAGPPPTPVPMLEYSRNTALGEQIGELSAQVASICSDLEDYLSRIEL